MAARLTEGSIAQIISQEYNSEDWKPVLQVLDLKQLHSQRNQDTERYRLVLSDGSHSQQGMLATQQNQLVNQGILQKGSVVCLNQFNCTTVQNRPIIIIISLDVIVDRCDIIGQPVPPIKNLNAPTSAGNVQSLSNGAHGAVHQTVTGVTQEPPRQNQSYGSSYSGHSEPGKYAATSTLPNYHRPESGSGFPGSAPVSGSYVSQNTGHSPKPEIPQLPQNSYVQPPQPTYQQTRPNTFAHQPPSTFQQPPPSAYGQPPAQINQQPPPMCNTNRGPAARNETPARINKISALNPYQGRWTIKARVIAKSLRNYSNQRGEGKVFTFDLLDLDGGEIRVICFNSVAEQFYNQIVVGEVYLISRGTIKPVQNNFNRLKSEYEINFDTTSTVQLCEDDGSIPHPQFNFQLISDVDRLESNTIVDVIGVVTSITPATSIMRKDGVETQKRTLQLKDISCCSIEVTLWGNLCNAEGKDLQNMCDTGVFPVLAVKAGRVNDFNGKGLGSVAATQLFIEPKIEEAQKVRIWFESAGRDSPCVSITREKASLSRNGMLKTISQIKDEKLGYSAKPDWITVSATVTFIKTENYFYTACLNMIGDRQCNKKVLNDGDGTWRCEKCNLSLPQCDYRYILNLQIQDHTGLVWVTAFQEGGEQIMGITAKEFYELQFENQEEKVAEIIRNVYFTNFIFTLKVKEETYSDESRVKSTVVKAEKVDFSAKARVHLDLIDKLEKGAFGSTSNVETVIPSAGMYDTGPGSTASRQYTPAVNVGHSAYATSASRQIGAPPNQVSQYGNQNNSPGFSGSGSAGPHHSCNICGGTSHNSVNCPTVMKNVPGQSSGRVSASSLPSRPVGNTSGECFKCHQPGHWARDCPGLNDISPAYGSSVVQPGRYGFSNQRASF